jgi:hypothetical protein
MLSLAPIREFLDAVQCPWQHWRMDDIQRAGTCIGGMIVPALVAMAENMEATAYFRGRHRWP